MFVLFQEEIFIKFHILYIHDQVLLMFVEVSSHFLHRYVIRSF